VGGGAEAETGDEMMDDELKQRRFLWGVALAWAPWIPTMIGLGYAFVHIGNSKATGLAAVAGGFAEMYILLGLAATLICEVSAMALLFAHSRAGTVCAAPFPCSPFA
jgi:biopolymer transport protein ExbB/TolQ